MNFWNNFFGGKDYHDFNMTFNAANLLKNDIDRFIVKPVAGVDGDMQSGTLADFGTKEAYFNDAMIGATGTQLRNYIDSVKALLSGYVLSMRKWADTAREGLQLAVNAEVAAAQNVAQTTSDTYDAAGQARAEAENLNLELDTTAFNNLNSYGQTATTTSAGTASQAPGAGNTTSTLN